MFQTYEHPMPGQMLAHSNFADDYTAEESTEDVPIFVANLLTSKVAQPEVHKVVVDIDMPCQLIPSSTPGHFHLLIDKELTWTQYINLLEALVDAGIVQDGYLQASLRRGYTAVRLPWIKKGN